jgi:FkbM family methyltransferase
MTCPRGIERVETIYGPFYVWENDLITTQLKKFSAHTRNELAMLRSFLREGDQVIDVGAHIGTFCIPFARFVGRRGRIYAFEGERANYALLQKNIRAQGFEETIRSVCAVVSDRGAPFEQLLPPDANGNTAMYYFVPRASSGGEHEPTSIEIDAWASRHHVRLRPQLLKIDTEGAEVHVLRACRGLIERHRPLIYCEINEPALHRFSHSPDDVEAFLGALGYHFFRNVGLRNSATDDYTIAPLSHLREGGSFFDVLAVHPASRRYPGRPGGASRVGLRRLVDVVLGIARR